MTFEPNYVPEKVDLVIAHNLIILSEDILNTIYSSLFNEFGFEAKVRKMPQEIIIPDTHPCYQKDLDSITKDSVILVHGNMTCDAVGVKGAMDLSKSKDARFIVTYAPTYYDKVIEAFPCDGELPYGPENQISLFEPEWDLNDVIRARGKIHEYFKQLAELRGKE